MGLRHTAWVAGKIPGAEEVCLLFLVGSFTRGLSVRFLGGMPRPHGPCGGCGGCGGYGGCGGWEPQTARVDSQSCQIG